MSTVEATLFVVDDEPAVRKSVAALAQSIGLACRTFESAEEFLTHYDPSQPGCLLADIRLGGMSGLDLQERLVQMRVGLPVILFSAYANVSVAVRAMRQGAATVIEKPYRADELSEAILAAIDADRSAWEKRNGLDNWRKRVANLTAREREVMERIVESEPNKVIARDLDLSMRTVARLRAAVFTKLKCESAVEVAQAVAEIRVSDEAKSQRDTFNLGQLPSQIGRNWPVTTDGPPMYAI